MKVEAWCKTDKGLRRESNQDSFLINPDLGLYIVADGMGGHKGGEVASAMAVKVIEEVVKNPPMKDLKPHDLLIFAYAEASRQIFDLATNERPELSGMGTTMVMLLVQKNKIYVANVGDSRCYLFRSPYLWQLTEDHSQVMELLRAGMLTEEQAENYSGKNVITRSVGYERDVTCDILERPLTLGDTFILCSDGLSGLVEDKEISNLMNRNVSEVCVEKAVEEALKNGGDDNVTVMIVKVTQ